MVKAAKAKVSHTPKGYRTVTPYLIVDDGKKALAFYQNVFGAKIGERFEDPQTGKIGHAVLDIGDSRVCLADEYLEWGAKSAKTIGGTPVSLMIYVKDVDAVVDRAIKAGATIAKPVMDQFYGDRSGAVTDPFGHSWYIHTHKEEVSKQEMERRLKAMATQKK